MTAIPSAVTAIGLVCGLLGLAIYPTRLGVALMLLSLALDVADGWLARRLGACTEAGAQFDWHTDCALAHLACARGGYFPGGNVALVLFQAAVASKGIGVRASGRALAFAALFLATLAR